MRGGTLALLSALKQGILLLPIEMSSTSAPQALDEDEFLRLLDEDAERDEAMQILTEGSPIIGEAMCMGWRHLHHDRSEQIVEIRNRIITIGDSVALLAQACLKGIDQEEQPQPTNHPRTGVRNAAIDLRKELDPSDTQAIQQLVEGMIALRKIYIECVTQLRTTNDQVNIDISGQTNHAFDVLPALEADRAKLADSENLFDGLYEFWASSCPDENAAIDHIRKKSWAAGDLAKFLAIIRDPSRKVQEIVTTDNFPRHSTILAAQDLNRILSEEQRETAMQLMKKLFLLREGYFHEVARIIEKAGEGY